MTNSIKLSEEARRVVSHLAAKSLEDESFRKEMDTLLAKGDDEIKKGLAIYIKNGFPDLVDKNLEKEILKELNKNGKGGGIIDLNRTSRGYVWKGDYYSK